MMKKDIRNIQKEATIVNFKKASKKKEIYKRISQILSASARKSVSINLSELEKKKNIIEGNIIIVPGKVLGTGNLNKKIIVYAYSFSESAKKKLGDSAKEITKFLEDKVDFSKCIIIK